MVSTPVPGFITKKDAAENYQRSHRQITRDLADAMKVQDPVDGGPKWRRGAAEFGGARFSKVSSCQRWCVA